MGAGAGGMDASYLSQRDNCSILPRAKPARVGLGGCASLCASVQDRAGNFHHPKSQHTTAQVVHQYTQQPHRGTDHNPTTAARVQLACGHIPGDKPRD